MTTGGAIRAAIVWAAVIAGLLQLFIEPTVTNMLCVLIVIVSTSSLVLYLAWTDALEAHPLSTYAIFGFSITSQFGALLIQTASWTSIDFLLYDPLYTFGVLAIFQAVALCTHAFYRYMYTRERDDKSLLRALFTRMGTYRTPSAASLWIMGCMGLASYSMDNMPGVIAKLVDGANFLVWAPFLIPSFRLQVGPGYAPRRTGWLLAAYAVAVAGIAVWTNVRSMLFIGIVTICLLYLFHGLRSRDPLPRGVAFKVALGGIVLMIAMQPLADFSIAMAVARDSRAHLTTSQLMDETMYIYRTPALLDRFRAQQATNTMSAYDEYYIKNPMFAKVIETKLADNAFYFAKALTSDESKRLLWGVTVDSCLAALPTPLLHLLKIDVDKSSITYSMGDFLVHLAKGRPLGGQKTGSQFAQGLALFGMMYPLIYAGICFVLFHFFRLLTSLDATGGATISAVGMTRIWDFFQHGITHDNLGYLFILVFRGLLEITLIYFVALSIARLILKDRYVIRQVAAA